MAEYFKTDAGGGQMQKSGIPASGQEFFKKTLCEANKVSKKDFTPATASSLLLHDASVPQTSLAM